MSEIDNSLPIEVSLAIDIKQCRDCQWFWGESKPYGPYTTHDYLESNLSNTIDTGKQSEKKMTIKGWQATTKKPDYIDPGILHGCRKAPIMTIGINPNLTAYFMSSASATWVYPNFSGDNELKHYAHYYRYKTIYQESIDKKILPEWQPEILKCSEHIIKAESSGWVLEIKRSKEHRWMSITVQYENKQKPVIHELSWNEEHKAIVNVSESSQYKDYLRGITKIKPSTQINEDDLLAYKILPKTEREFTVYKKSVKYYQRMLPVIEKFKKLVDEDNIYNANIRIGEDISQHDMINCASPGWSTNYDIPAEAIENNCIHKNGYIIKQIFQSKPAIIIIVGKSSFDMFFNVFKQFITLDNSIDDAFYLLKETSRTRYELKLDLAGQEYSPRIIVVPHFSYDDNYKSHCRFTSDEWNDFKSRYKNDYQVLVDHKRNPNKTWNGNITIEFNGVDDVLKTSLSATVFDLLIARHTDPTTQLATVLAEEYAVGNIRLDESGKSLTRTDGPCQFCDNSEWKLKDGCIYGKTSDGGGLRKSIEKAVNEITG